MAYKRLQITCKLCIFFSVKCILLIHNPLQNDQLFVSTLYGIHCAFTNQSGY